MSKSVSVLVENLLQPYRNQHHLSTSQWDKMSETIQDLLAKERRANVCVCCQKSWQTGPYCSSCESLLQQVE